MTIDERRERHKLNQRVWFAAHRDEVNARARRRRLLDPVYRANRNAVQRSEDPEKVRARLARWRAANPEKVAAQLARKRESGSARRGWLWYRYKLTPIQEHALWATQGGACAICRRDLEEPRLDGTKRSNRTIDHDHATGRVRGLLCHKCNGALGGFADDPALLRTALAYLAGAK